MIDLTPLDVRNKRGDFRKGIRGYEPHEVDAFLESVADRMDVLVRENMALRERTEELLVRVERQEARESAVQEALVSAQSLREEIREQARREGELLRRETEEEVRRLQGDAQREAQRLQQEAERFAEAVRVEVERMSADAHRELEELERSRRRFLKAYRGLLERELDVVEVEESRAAPTDLDLDALRIFEGGRGQVDHSPWKAAGPAEAPDQEEAHRQAPYHEEARHEAPHHGETQHDEAQHDEAQHEEVHHEAPEHEALHHDEAHGEAAPFDEPRNPERKPDAVESGAGEEAPGASPRYGVDLATAREREARTHDPG